jgi:hypothetical protein
VKLPIKYVLVVLFFIANSTNAQYYYFGRNKVQYEKFDWKIIRTKHFNIYYYGEMGEMAEIGAKYAEEAYEELKVRMNTFITRKVPLIFYNTSNQFQQTNTTPGFIPEGVGGFFEFLKGRVVLPTNGSLQDFKHVIRHELVHVFMTSKIYHILKEHRMSTDNGPPLWFVEGLAEFYSTKPDAQAEMVMRDAVLNGNFFDLKNIWKIYGTFLMYKEGQSFLEFVEEKYGKGKVALILDNFWMFKSFEDVVSHTLVESFDEIDKEWEFYLKKKYYPLYSNNIPQSISSKELTDFGYNFTPVFYKEEDHNYLFFVANRSGYSSIYKLELDENLKPIHDPILLIQGEQTEEFEAFHLFQSAIDISKDGLLVFSIKSGATDVIHFFSVKENKIVKTFQNDQLLFITSPKFSSDGNEVVFQAIDQKGFSDIYIYNLSQDSLTRLTNDYYDDRDPSFGINDNQILFSSDRTSGVYQKKYNIFSYDRNNQVIKYVTYNNFNCYSPIIAPDKKNLLMATDFDGVRNIWEVPLTISDYSNKISRVTKFITSAFDQRFINDSVIVFSGFEKFSFNLYELTKPNTEKDSMQSITIDFSGSHGRWKPEVFGSAKEIKKVDYEREYSLDFATGVVSTDPIFGTRGGALLALSDLLGDDRYIFTFFNTATVQSDFLRSFNIALQKVNLSKRVNYGYGVFNFSGNRYDITESDEYFYERTFGATTFLSYPLSKFNRIEYSITMMNSDREIVPGIIARKSLLLSNSVAYVHDNSLWGPSGPIDGSRWLFLLGYSSDIKYSNINYYSVIADYRNYFRLSYSMAIALRMSLYYNDGKEARRYFMGGSWDLRGYPRWSIRGEKMWLSSLEFRFPLIDQILLKFPFVDLNFYGIRGATFFDVGSAWDNEYKTTYGSMGVGFRFNLFNVIVLRYDIGKKIENDFSQFQPGLFYQFFFGWDF